MKRRDFLRLAGGSAAASGAAGTAVAQQDDGTDTGTTAPGSGNNTAAEGGGSEPGVQSGTTVGTGTEGGDGGGGGGGGGTETVAVGPDGSLKFVPGTDEPLRVAPGTTVEWVWESDTHNVVPDSQPEGANWEGTPGGEGKTYDTGYTYTHTFGTEGTYEYYCAPHESAGMVATLEVTQNPNEGGGEKSLHDLGVPIQAHWVGSATVLGIIVSVVYTFYILKYGESPHTGTGGEE